MTQRPSSTRSKGQAPPARAPRPGVPLRIPSQPPVQAPLTLDMVAFDPPHHFLQTGVR